VPDAALSPIDVLARDKPWASGTLELPKWPIGMLWVREAMLYYYLTKDAFQGLGAIIDGGSFLGMSASFLAHGLRENPKYEPSRDKIHCLDNFLVNESATVDFIRDKFARTMCIGDSTRELFESQVEPIAGMLAIHAGDFLHASWPAVPIEILLVDLAKTRELCGRVIEILFPHLLPGQSVVVHQDYHHPWLPHIHIVMEYLADYFELVIPRIDDSAVFLYSKAIPPDILRRASEFDFSYEEQLELMDGAVSRLSEKDRYYVELARIYLQSQSGELATLQTELDRLHNEFREIAVDYTPHPYFEGIRRHLDLLEGWNCNGEGHFERCLEVADRLLAGYRDSYGMTLRGCALSGLRRYAEAEAQLTEALSSTSAPACAYLEMARVLFFQNRYAEAQAELLRGLPKFIAEQLVPTNYIDLLRLIWKADGPCRDRSAVIEQFREALPNEPEVWALDALWHEIAGDQ
jgi:tetratricopeptide (TPR) repeat protein